MANRVLLNSTGFKVSKPGINVLTTTEKNLLFSSEFAGLAPSWQGSFPVVGSQIRTTSNYNPRLVSVPGALASGAYFIVIGADNWTACGIGKAGFGYGTEVMEWGMEVNTQANGQFAFWHFVPPGTGPWYGPGSATTTYTLYYKIFDWN